MFGKLTLNQTVGFALLMLIGLSACGVNDDDTELTRQPTQEELEAVWEEAQPIIEDELAKEDARSAIRFPCTLYDKKAASALLSAELEAPAFAHEIRSSNNIDTGTSYSWQSEACSWSNWGDGASLYIWVSRPDDFEDGRVLCHGIYDEDTTEALFGGDSKWVFLKSFAWAKLLVCRDDGLFFVEIHDGPADEAAAKGIAMEIADRVAAAL